MAFIRYQCWGTTARGIIYLFPAIPNGTHTHWQLHMKKHVSLNLPSMTWNTLDHFYPTKHKILFTFSHPSEKNFLVVFPDLQLNSNWHHKDSAPFQQLQSVTRATHLIGVQSYEALHGAATIHKTSDMIHDHHIHPEQPGQQVNICATKSKTEQYIQSLYWVLKMNNCYLKSP